ncbi:MOSC domain-containing protein [Olivibacter domesticus]|uniref:MOSC domain-containing protein n=1 Tax=Olivibacter domesticus TaxID=407022 RepID=A0A1H7URW5_OLID1|nr:MOSC N-terminal beta barrel domain-containing protein [Olivibacter domesticus]SEL99712.1 hypothetical protein SAMN05661044_03918 [Olivibacter domesticus]
MLTISELYIYPIKSLGGVSLSSAEVTDRGFKYDRRWMLVDAHNRFLTQREVAQMALIKVAIEEGGLSLTHPRMEVVKVPFYQEGQDEQLFTIWNDTCKGVLVKKELDDWFSDALAMKCRLVYMPERTHRQVDQQYAPDGMITSFSDAYPFLTIGQASLDDLNGRLDEPLPMNRFRPNIVFSGGHAFEEDVMHHIRIGNIDFYGVKLCARCVVTTIDQQTAEKAKEPLKTLASYRSKNKKIMFGQNLIHTGAGLIRVGDRLEVLSMHTEERFLVG